MVDKPRAQPLIEQLNGLLIAWSKNEKSAELAAQLVNLYFRFMITVHHDLVMQEDQGALQATAACISVWEMLHFHSSLFGPLRGSARAFVVSLLTALYPKAKDRRCLYQHVGCVGGLGSPRVPLTTHLPMSAEVMKCISGEIDETDAYDNIVAYVQNTVSAEECIFGSPSVNELKEKVKTFTESVLPRIYFAKDKSNTASVGKTCDNAIIIPLTGEASSPMRSYDVLQQTIWKYLVLLHAYSPEDRNSLGNFLTTSSWSQRSVCLADDLKVTYATFVGPFVHEAAVCTSLMPSVASDAADNTPMIHPRLLEVLLQKENSSEDSSLAGENLTEAFIPDRLTRRTVSMAHATAASMREMLVESIPQEIAFCDESASCRDCDKLTQLCRGAVLSPVVQDTGSDGLSDRAMRRMLFDRKRRRDDDFYEGPVLLPVASSLSEMLDEKVTKKSLSTLERIASS